MRWEIGRRGFHKTPRQPRTALKLDRLELGFRGIDIRQLHNREVMCFFPAPEIACDEGGHLREIRISQTKSDKDGAPRRQNNPEQLSMQTARGYSGFQLLDQATYKNGLSFASVNSRLQKVIPIMVSSVV
jgi:hypothetical protein